MIGFFVRKRTDMGNLSLSPSSLSGSCLSSCQHHHRCNSKRQWHFFLAPPISLSNKLFHSFCSGIFTDKLPLTPLTKDREVPSDLIPKCK
uniref:Uncharacterized protein n=1 Tax=Nelumbo nucifera TaxID=4432 RepID=A0A822ZIW4_NELNU|nr:TPA_asm: hypothetical protein HUJ06_001801 [Nelumbo nucifera]